MNGDFNLKENILDRKDNEKKYIYTGSQILNNSMFKNKIIEPFSMNLIWDLLIKSKELLGVISKQEFLHVSNLKIYNELIEKRF
jgi:MurNAc alpha-1-phosphate uridylyltransferase